MKTIPYKITALEFGCIYQESDSKESEALN